MRINISQRNMGTEKASIAGFFLSGKDKRERIGRIETVLGCRLKGLLEDFDSKDGSTAFSYVNHDACPRVFIMGIGEVPTLNSIREATVRFGAKVKELSLSSAVLDTSKLSELADFVSDTPSYTAQAIIEGFIFGVYSYDRHKTSNVDGHKADKKVVRSKSQDPSLTLHVRSAISQKVKSAVEIGQIISEAQSTTRTLVNAPSNFLTAEDLARYVLDSSKKYGYKATIFDKKKISRLKMGGLMAVNQGSKEPPTFSILEHKPRGAKLKLALIGKGVTFDTGGISIKPSQGMGDMKADMGGAAAVIGAMEAASQLKLPIEVYGLIPATDNKPSGSAQNPGDVITTFSGVTVEVLNTDAEGRLILADALGYAKKVIKPDIMIDLATLTGACVVALGSHAAGFFSHNVDLSNRLYAAGTRSGEKVWQLPLWDDYNEYIKSSVADVKNTGGSNAGAITAAKFLEKFVEGHSAWAHIDIAGPTIPKHLIGGCQGALPGYGVRLLVEFMQSL